ncbi:Ribonuclease H-like superfamily protein [Gossypium australe]|uniref:Ribonuclease H-like superfamily protein n=1 Tax=Gossypium australe TaxID=47621 RepID=A0A5B6W6M0_9ROSI|nr:Ribonuclease H-like superfamily protein [Gossypium australe]
MTRFLSIGGKEVFIKAEFWWQKQHNKRDWRKLGDLKEDGGMGFRVMSKFNIALLAKQGWRLICYPDSLLARSLGNLPSFTWRIKDLLEKGMRWRVGSGEHISIWNGAWVHENKWREELIRNTFHQEEAEKILCIPIPSEKEADSMVWSAEASGTYTVRSGYKLLLQNDQDINLQTSQSQYKPLYKKNWLMDLPTKIKILVWKSLNNFLPTQTNLFRRKLVSSTTCPRCSQNEETMEHVFRDCPLVHDIWARLGIGWTLDQNQFQFKDWIKGIFENQSNHKVRTVMCALWAVWTARNK